MAEIAAGIRASQAVRLSFFFWMTIVMAFIIFGGFGVSYFLPLLTGTLRPVAPVVHFHGFFYFAWMLLLVMQSSLIANHNVALHRSMGIAGVSLATGLVIFASIVSILLIGMQIEQGINPDVYGLMYISILAVGIFSTLFVMAVRNIHHSEAHKRFILLATIGFLGAGINRFYQFVLNVEFAPFWTLYVLADLLIVAIVIYDWRKLGRIHTATMIGAAVNIIPQLLHAPIVSSSRFESLTHWLVALGGYS